MTFDVDQVDRLLTTTRAVRKKLDFEREVTNELLLQRREEVAALLGIPDGFTQVVLFPVAYTTQADFRPVERRPAREITYFDEWGFTDRNIPPDQRRNPLEGRGVSVSIDVAAPIE